MPTPMPTPPILARLDALAGPAERRAGLGRAGPRARRAAPPRVLLIAAHARLPYRVLRCMAATGAEVFVLGGAGARGLRHSRYCERFFDFAGPIDGRGDAELALEIDRLARALGIDLVAPADAPSTRALAQLSPRLSAPCFPLPELAAFDLLNDKWRFTRLCGDLDIAHPPSRLFRDGEALRAEARRGGLSVPLIAKPLSEDGGLGCVEVPDEAALGRLDAIAYAPVIVQRYVPGVDIGASMFCRDGEIEAQLTHSYLDGVYRIRREAGVSEPMSRIARRLKLTGVFNFDMRLTDAGEVFFLECNPRFYFKIAMSMLAGLNFVELGLPWRRGSQAARTPAPVALPFPRALLAALPAPWTLDPTVWRVLRFLAADPVPVLREGLRIERGR